MSEMTANNILVEMNKITKAFPGVLANDEVDLKITAREIHALLGENGAGKSTLMSILTGLYRNDGGELRVHGKNVKFDSPRDAIREGIGMVHQHFKLVPTFSVLENVAMGLETSGVILRLDQIEKKLAEFSEEYGFQIDPHAKVWQLSIGEQQRVEIIKLLFRGADILILDEPTAVLTPQEANELYVILRKMADEGKGVIVITHKMQEVMEHADTVTVMRGGKSVATIERSATTEDELAKLMVGKELVELQNHNVGVTGDKILSLENIKVFGDRGQEALKGISLNLRAGEILGIAGVTGNGQRELAEAITGLRNIESGSLLIDNVDLTNKGSRKIIEAGVAHIPEDRCGTGLVPSLDASENVLLKHFRDPEFRRGPFVKWKSLKSYTRKLVEDFEVKISSLIEPVKSMSGGNLQRLLLAREISCEPRIIVAVYPVRGLDIGAIQAVRKLLLEARTQGKGVILISEELEELFQIADRITVLHEGTVMGTKMTNETNISEIGLMMAGKTVNNQCA